MQSQPWVGNTCHTTVKTYIEKNEWHDNYFSWSFVRNPLDRLVSSYFWAKKNNYNFEYWHADLRKEHVVNFDTFVRWLDKADIENDILLKPQHSHILYNGTIKVDFIGRFENLNKDWSYVTNKIMGKEIPMQHKNKTDHKHYMNYYNDSLIEIAYNKYKKDFQLFDYETC
jgi:chondroitin 4-sulfotransferase 11